MTNPKVFVSYSWSSPEHEKWVYELALRLVENGVDVILDKWNLNEGQDTISFMEQSIKNRDTKHVLLICDRTYKQKAETRQEGTGVSTEAQIITTEIYDSVDSTKFIAILTGEFESSNEVLPTFVQTRKFIDFSNLSEYEQSFELLLRAIHDKPLYVKPKIGEIPEYLNDDAKSTSVLEKHIKTLEFGYSMHNSYKVKTSKEDFTYEYIQEVDKLLPDDRNSIEQNDLLDLVYEALKSTNSIGIYFRKISKKIIQYDDSDSIDFWETIFQRLMNMANKRENIDVGDFFRFVIFENFLFLVSELLHKDSFTLLEKVLTITIQNSISSYKSEIISLSDYRFYSTLIDKTIKKRQNIICKTLISELLYENALLWEGANNLIDADIFLHYVSMFNYLTLLKKYGADEPLVRKYSSSCWISRLYFCDKRVIASILWMMRLKSLRYFESVKIFFDVNTIKEFREKYAEIESCINHPFNPFGGTFASIPKLDNVIPLKEIGVFK